MSCGEGLCCDEVIELGVNHSHSVINRPSKPAGLKDLAVTDMGLYRRFYHQKRTSFAGAEDGAICGVGTLTAPSTSTERILKIQRRVRSPPTDQFTYPGLNSFSIALATVPKALMTPSMTKSSARP